MVRHVWAAAALLVAASALAGCTTSVAGRAIRAPGISTSATATPSSAPISARSLLLGDGDNTPFGAATATSVGETYFTSAKPSECAAALLFKGSPLLPAGSSGHAEAAYRFAGPALYAESVDVYDKALDTHDVVWNGFAAVSDCHGDAVGVSPSGQSPPMRLSFFGTVAEGVLVWTMTRPDWTCDYGLAVVPRVAVLLSACDAKPGFPMAEWASTRRSQIESQTS